MIDQTIIFGLEGVMLPLIGIWGILGNVISIIVLQSKKVDLTRSFCQLLITLAVFDIIFLVSAIVSFSLPLLSDNWRMHFLPVIWPYLMPFAQISMNGSVWSVVSIAIERYISIVYAASSFSNVRGKCFIIPTIVLTVVWNIPRFFELETCVKENNVTSLTPSGRIWVKIVNVTDVCATDMRQNISYCRDYITIANFLIMMLIPFLLITVMNSIMWKTIKRTSRLCGMSRRQRRDRTVAMLLSTVVLIFFCCNTIRFGINTFESGPAGEDYKDYSTGAGTYFRTKILNSFSHLLLVFNSSINILIYCWKDPRFRVVLMSMLRLYRNFVTFNSIMYK